MSAITVNTNWSVARFEDGVLTISLEPPEPIGGWSLQTVITKRFGGTPIITRSLAPGYVGTSGMNIISSGLGQFSVVINSPDFSGHDPGAYAFQISRVDSGNYTNTTQGFGIITL